MNLALKRRIGRLLNRLGYDVRRAGKGFHVDPFEDQRILLRGRDVRVVFDVGANVGQTAGAYLERFPDAIVHSFEPFDSAYAQLTQTWGAHPRFRSHRVAVADHVGTRSFYVSRESAASSLLPASSKSRDVVPDTMLSTVAQVEVPTTTLDAFCTANGIESLPVLKMDIQGGELLALRGAEGLLRRSAIDLVYTEVLFAEQYDGQADFVELVAHLRERGYSLYALYHLTRGVNGLLGWGDAIFVSPRLRDQMRGSPAPS
jgi:FkbM family methyltransferase